MTTDVKIERVGFFGEGVGTDAEGKTYFVSRAIPGDRVRIRPLTDSKRYRDAELVEVLEPSPDRVSPACSHFDDCGGCDWLHWDYAKQLEAKENMLRYAFSRAGVVPEEQLPIVGATRRLGYRNRIQVRTQSGRVGFLRRHSHDLVPIDNCAVADVRLNQALETLRQGRPNDGKIRKTELFLTSDGTVSRIDDAPHGAAGFAQVNSEQNAALQKTVTAWAKGSQRVLELYCGAGNLTFSFLGGVSSVLGVDASSATISMAERTREALPDGEKQKVQFIKAPVSGTLSQRLPSGFTRGYDTLVLNPPRVGTAGVLPFFLHPGLERIVYVSCSAESFIKDAQCVKTLFRLQSIQPVDMFPHTRHVEFVALFSRLSS